LNQRLLNNFYRSVFTLHQNRSVPPLWSINHLMTPMIQQIFLPDDIWETPHRQSQSVDDIYSHLMSALVRHYQSILVIGPH